MINSNLNPHQGQPVAKSGASLDVAQAAVVMVHGRGATAESILTLAEEFKLPGIAYLAPQAEGNTWYPYSFLAPMDQNSPGISSGLKAIQDVVDQIEGAGITKENIVLLGFSQGACLASEFAARNADRYGGVVSLSGGVIGPDGTPRDYKGSLRDTPVFLGCSDVDSHIPVERVHLTADVFENLGGKVTKRIYEGMDHTVNQDEIAFVKDLLKELIQ